MVWTTLPLWVSMTDTSLVAVLVTNTAPFLAYTAVGCRPTSMLLGAAVGFARSMTLTVPVVVAPVFGLAGTSVPYELIVVSPGLARRPPSLLTYSLLPTWTMPRGAMPTAQLCLMAPVTASSATTR